MAEDGKVLIEEEPATGRAAGQCLKRYYEELNQRFEAGFDPRKSVLGSLDEFSPPKGSFLVVRMDGEPVGCGGIKLFGREYGELKRMYVRPQHRGHGFGKLILDHLAQFARVDEITLLRLETGIHQRAAIRLYENAGFYRIPPFGPYTDDPLSLCYEKRIVRS